MKTGRGARSLGRLVVAAATVYLPTALLAQVASPAPAPTAGVVESAGGDRPAFRLLRSEEDWSALRDPARRTDLWDPLKYVPPRGRDDTYLTLGGETRQWFESFHDDTFGLGPGDRRGNNTYFLQRYLLHGDLRLGPDLRLFGQAVSGFEDGRVGGPRPDIDRNQFDLHQGFVDWRWPTDGADAVTWRLGRQEFEYGTGRLVDVREGPNLRLAFDAARFLATAGAWAVDGWWAKPVRNRPGTLDDDPSPDESFWGVYGVRPAGDGDRLTLDLYYLGYENRAAVFAQGAGGELRHSVGTRAWGKPGRWEYNLEYVGQFGTFAGGRIAAWTAAHAARYTFADLPLKPRPGLRFDVASGDGDASSRTLNTFNPLFPSGSYFNLTGPFGPQNVIDLHPTLDLTVTEALRLSADWNFFWRQRTADGVYRLSGDPIVGAQGSRARYVGSSPAVTAVWSPAAHVTALASYVHVFPGAFLTEATPGEAVDYVTTRLTYRF